MTSKSFEQLGHLQRAIIELVWQLGEANVHQVRAQLARRKKLAYTTVLSVMQKLEKAGWLKHRTAGRSYVYFATRSREETGAKSMRRFLERIFNDDALLMFQHLVKQCTLSDEELLKLKKMIDNKRKEMKK